MNGVVKIWFILWSSAFICLFFFMLGNYVLTICLEIVLYDFHPHLSSYVKHHALLLVKQKFLVQNVWLWLFGIYSLSGDHFLQQWITLDRAQVPDECELFNTHIKSLIPLSFSLMHWFTKAWGDLVFIGDGNRHEQSATKWINIWYVLWSPL